MNRLSDRWNKVIASLVYAFQPIVQVHTGTLFGLEALLRGWDAAGFSSIQALFDEAAADGCLHGVDLRLRRKAIEAFQSTGLSSSARLFYNLDNRVLKTPDYSYGDTRRILDEFGLAPPSICFEISERHEVTWCDGPNGVLQSYKQQHYHIALDDFGSGYSGLQLLYLAEPDLIKIDRFFIDAINTDGRKKLFVTNIVNMAHIMGMVVIAEGVQTEDEYFACRDIGCDFIQGYLIQRPVTDPAALSAHYQSVVSLAGRDRRCRDRTLDLVNRQLHRVPPLCVTEPMTSALEHFRRNRHLSFCPIINENDEPLGILRERDLKAYVYSPFGFSMLRNLNYRNDMYQFLFRAPAAEGNMRLEKMMELYALNSESDAILITENGKYRGYLDSRSLVRLLHEREVAEARDQNPLTRLPGNNVIADIIAERLAVHGESRVFVYFDFDNFKPFNDAYGFRQGDRAILLFAELLRRNCPKPDWFVGHVGGDDFLACLSKSEIDVEAIKGLISDLARRFAEDVVSFYGPEERAAGCIEGKDREGRTKRFPLLTVSAGLLVLGPGPTDLRHDDFFGMMAQLKAAAKAGGNGIATRHLCVGLRAAAEPKLRNEETDQNEAASPQLVRA